MFYKGGGSNKFIPKELNCIGGTQAIWRQSPPYVQGTGPTGVQYLVGGWFRPWNNTPGGAQSVGCQFINQDLDQSSVTGYSTQRWYTDIKSDDTFQFNANSYRYGGSSQASWTIPRYGDRDQWYHIMCVVMSNTDTKWILNGKHVFDITYGSNVGPWINADNDLTSYLFSRRYGGATAENRCYEGWLHNYFICDLNAYFSAFASRGVVTGDYDSLINPWATNKFGQYLDPITDEDDPGRQSALIAEGHGAYWWVSNTDWMNDYRTGNHGYRGMGTGLGNKTLTKMPVYGYDQRGT